MFGKKNSNTAIELFTLFDSKAKFYSQPSPAKNSEDMIRSILNMFKDPRQNQNPYLMNAEDFSLFKIGSFDSATGLIESQNLEHIANLHDLRTMSGPSMERPVQDLGIVPT